MTAYYEYLEAEARDHTWREEYVEPLDFGAYVLRRQRMCDDYKHYQGTLYHITKSVKAWDRDQVPRGLYVEVCRHACGMTETSVKLMPIEHQQERFGLPTGGPIQTAVYDEVARFRTGQALVSFSLNVEQAANISEAICAEAASQNSEVGYPGGWLTGICCDYLAARRKRKKQGKT